MLAEERRHKILELLHRNNRVIAKELSEMFDMSIDSIRRDLTMMEEQGLLQKTYGGAIPPSVPSKVRTLPRPHAERYGEGAPHQNAISKLAASYIGKHDTVYIGGAGIHFGMLKYLPDDIPFTVVTNSLAIAETIRMREHIDSYLVGGKLRATSGGSMIDTVAAGMIGQFTLDTGFVTGGAVSAAGITTATPEGASFTRAVSAVCRRTICLAPHEKFGADMFARSIPAEQIDLLITDTGAPEKLIDDLRSKGVQVVIAAEETADGGNGHEMD